MLYPESRYVIRINAYNQLILIHLISDNKIARGCAATLTAEEVEVCNDAESNVCDWCEGENCNTKAPPSSANVLSTLSVLALLAMASVSLWF